MPDSSQPLEPYIHGSGKLAPGETLTFDTFYNSFCYTKYREYTSVSEVIFSCKFSGRAIVEIYCYDGDERLVCFEEFCGGAELSVKLSSLPKNGFLYPKLVAKTDFSFISGAYLSDCEPQGISCCIVICTYKRESYVLRNVDLLRNYDFSFINRVYVIDNGGTLDTHALSDDKIIVLSNKNYGGSGGFTRGLIEAHDNGFSHVILMDDDIEFHNESLEQMTVFASLLRKKKEKSWISAGMIPLDEPRRLFELGAEWTGTKSIVHKNNVDITDRRVLLDTLDNSEVEYGGWWTLLMPISVTERGLPYPFFIKFDDVEYGMRKPQNEEIITMNGIAIRHEAFDRKKSFCLDYYNLRNELVVDSVYGKYGVFGAIKRTAYEFAKQLCLYRYDNLMLIFRAVNDFLDGPEGFLRRDEEKLNNELIAAMPKLVPLSSIPGWSEELKNDDHKLDKRITVLMVLTLGGHLIPSFMLDKNISSVPLSRTGAVDCFGKREVIQYQLGGAQGLITRRSFAKFVKYGVLSVGMLVKLMVGFGRSQKKYILRSKELTSFKFWREHLGIR